MEQKIALITGANSGLGKAVTMVLSKMGIHVVMLCRDRIRGEAAQAEVEKKTGEKPTLMLCDLGSIQDVQLFCDGFKKQFSRLDILVNNAGVIPLR